MAIVQVDKNFKLTGEDLGHGGQSGDHDGDGPDTDSGSGA